MNVEFALVIFASLFVGSLSQRVAPGVPPQHYQPQQHVPIQQQHQVPVQHHQVPVQPQYQQQQQIPQQQQQQIHQQQMPPQQQQQMPPQQQQQMPPQQQQPHQQMHQHQGHQSGHHNPQLLNPGNIEHEKQHIQEHMDVPIDTSKMSEQELQFHYFKMHDADNNNKLDGCELIKSLIHWHGEEEKENTPMTDETLANLVDNILIESDLDSDGYVDWIEYNVMVRNAQETEDNPEVSVEKVTKKRRRSKKREKQLNTSE
ncbi:uncharacterized protein LOC143915174 isoform X1 [Arctopsyche grandis]|uniref:uncharacterized protein LOC143915174 isoform X1 n=1 Tax=Arctopsyche grandis TaxID=121162 RepID=UPI00406D733F